MKKILSLLLAVALVFSLAACAAPSEEDNAEIIQTAVDNLNDAKSLSYTMEMSMDLSASGQSASMKYTIDADYITDPILMKMVMTMNLYAMSVQTTSYAEDNGDSTCTIYTTVDGNTWTKDVQDINTLEYDAQATLSNYADNLSSITRVGAERIDGVSAMRYDCVISKDSIAEVLETSGVGEMLSALSMNVGLPEVTSALQDISFSIWIDMDNLVPVKYSLDMSEFFESLFAMIGGEEVEGVSVSNLTTTISLRNINAVESFEIPDAAKNS